MKRRRQCSPKRLRALSFLITILLILLWKILPYNNPIRLSLRFNANAVATSLFSPLQTPWWVNTLPAYPVTLADDVVVVMKSGFGTKHRIPAWLQAHEGKNLTNVLLIADFASRLGESLGYDGRQLRIYDMIAEMRGSGSIPADMTHPRLLKYGDLSEAILTGDLDAAAGLSMAFGWELDAMKFISGLELCYNQMPGKKWYLMVDDDTYLVQQTLTRLLEHLDPNIPYYIGNAVGDYRGRFAHGGSGVILSQAAMRQLFSHPDVVAAAHLEAFGETWGDKLLATTMIKVGIYLDERYSPLFNGEHPRKTQITKERSCPPIISFHELRDPTDMTDADQTLRTPTNPIRWIDLWEMFGAPAVDSPVWKSGRKNWDHVGRLDGVSTTANHVRTAHACAERCQSHGTCLAWTWESWSRACHLSPWMIPGVEADGTVSGIHVPRAKIISNGC